MEVTKELRPMYPVDIRIDVSPGGKFKQDRGRNGFHKGVDIKTNWGTEVWASERGVVVLSELVEGSATKGNYGNVIVIDHVHEAGRSGRHIYSLYAHLDDRRVYHDDRSVFHRRSASKEGDTISKGDTIGTTGNSGTRDSYKTKDKKGKKIEKEDQGSFHLHFEIIDSPWELTWGPGSFHRSDFRVNPMMGGGYVDSILKIKYDQKEGLQSMFKGSSRFRRYRRYN